MSYSSHSKCLCDEQSQPLFLVRLSITQWVCYKVEPMSPYNPFESHTAYQASTKGSNI